MKRRFIIKFLIFLIPLLIIVSIPMSVLFGSKEHYQPIKVIKMQSSILKPVLFGQAYTDEMAYYKLNMVKEKNPQVVVLGTSRVMTFRSKFFKDEYRFVNAGGGITRINHFRIFLDNIPEENYPELLIIGLDQYFFNENWDDLKDDDYKDNKIYVGNEQSPIGIFLNSEKWLTIFKKIVKDLISRKYSIKDIFDSNDSIISIGLNAIINNNGFLNDGSYRYGEIISNPENAEDYKYKDTYTRIEKGIRRFEYGDEVNKNALEELELFLKDCQEKGINVIGFLPPYAHEIFEKMRDMREDYQYLFKLYNLINPIFEKYSYEFYDFSDIHSFGGTDNETIDGFHGSEKANLKLFIKIIEDGEILKGYTDLDYLRLKLEESESDYDVFYYEF